MSVVLLQDMPNGTRDMVEAVTKEMDVEHNPPPGLIVHTACELPTGGIRIIDVWQDQASHEAFANERIMPAMETVMQRLGVDPQTMGMPEQTFLDAFDVKMGR